MKKILSLSAFIFLFSACTQDSWTGLYYPDGIGGDVNKWEIEEGFNSKQECLDWINSIEKENENWDYECGKNCDGGLGVITCEKMEK